jgi:hypothetical protein
MCWGGWTAWDGAAAEKALRLMARRRTGRGERFAPDAATLAQADRGPADGADGGLPAGSGLWRGCRVCRQPPEVLARHPLTGRGWTSIAAWCRSTARLGVPVIGLGASAPPITARWATAGLRDDPAGTCRGRQCHRRRGGAGGAARDRPCLQPRRGALCRASARGAGGLCHARRGAGGAGGRADGRGHRPRPAAGAEEVSSP